MSSFDYSLKVRGLLPSKPFPRIVFPGLTRKEFSLVPYTDTNVKNMRDGYSTIASVRNYDDSVARDSSFKFAEGFNDVGYCIELADHEIGTSDVNSFSVESVINPLGFFPSVLAYETGKYFAERANAYQGFNKPHPFAYIYQSRASSITRKCFIRDTNAIGSTKSRSGAIPRKDIIELFRNGAKEEDFVFLLLLIEKFADLVEEGYIADYLLITFYALNEFLEHGKDNEFFVDYFSNVSNAEEVSRQYNTITVKKYSHTNKLIESMILPNRLFNSNSLHNSIVRKAISEQEKHVLKTAIYFNKPIPEDKYSAKETTAKRFRKLFDTIRLAKELNININAHKYEGIVLTDLRQHNSNTYRSNRIGDFFDEYLKKENASERTSQVVNYLQTMLSNEVCDFIIEIIEKDKDNKVKKHNLAVLMYAICFPRAINEYSSARVALIVDYALHQTNYNVDFVADILMQLIINFESAELSINDWKTVIDCHNSGLQPRQVVNIVATESPRSVKNKKHDNQRLDHIVEIYEEKRPVL